MVVLLAAAWATAASAPPRFEAALAEQFQQVAARPNDVAALNDLGNLLAHVGRLVEAEETYQRALAIDPQHVTSRYNLALLLLERRDPRRAREELERVLELAPNHAWAHYQLGALHQTQGHRKRAMRRYAEAFAINPSLADPLNNPHVVGNPLATEAMIQSYELQLPAVQVPRSYAEPDRVTDLLVPGSQEPAEPAEPAEQEMETVDVEPSPPQASKRSQRRFRASFSEADEEPTTEESEGGSMTAEEELAAGMQAVEAEGVEAEGGEAELLADEDFSEEGVEEQSAEAEESSDEAPVGLPGIQGGTFEDNSPPSPGTLRPAPPLSGRGRRTFTPGLGSTGALELELLPAQHPAWVAT